MMRIGSRLGLVALALILLNGIQGQASAQSAEGTEFIFTFETDAQGWATGFADLPADFDQGLFELDSGLRLLPDGLEGNGIFLQGHNRSDDLFMFLKKQVDGLRPETAYDVTVSLDLATNVPVGLVGIGGSPGESVYVKAGASTIEPVIQQDDTGHLRMNIDKGNQASEGESMINLGNIANPEVAGGEFKIKTLGNDGRPFKVVSDSEGRVWLIVGTDSGFEGLSAVYYATITYTLSESFEVDGPCSLTRAAQLPIEFEYKGTIPTGFDGINRASCRFTKPVKTVTINLTGEATHTETFTLSEPAKAVSFPLPEGTLSITTLEIVPPGEYQREMTVTSVDGETLVISDQPGVLKIVTILEPVVFEVGPCLTTLAAQLPIEFEYKGTIPTGFDGINKASCTFTKPVKTVTVTLSGPAKHSEVFTLSEPTSEVPFPLPEGTLSIATLEIVPPGEYQRKMTVTSVSGETLVISDLPGVLKTVTILPVELPNTGDFTLPPGALAGAVVLGIILAGFGTAILARRGS